MVVSDDQENSETGADLVVQEAGLKRPPSTGRTSDFPGDEGGPPIPAPQGGQHAIVAPFSDKGDFTVFGARAYGGIVIHHCHDDISPRASMTAKVVPLWAGWYVEPSVY